MAGNSFGKIFRITTFGESHGPGLGVVIDGCPAGLALDMEFIQAELDRRRPGQSSIVTTRKEPDTFQILSGTFEDKTTGTPLTFYIQNTNQKPKDYSHIKDSYRPSHADMTYDKKYGHRDFRGGGRASARETAARVVAGAVAKLLLKQIGISINAGVTQVGTIRLESDVSSFDWSQVENNIVRCPAADVAKKMELHIAETKKKGDTVGGRITCFIEGCPVGLGEPVFDKLHADLGKAMLSINAVKGFEYGSGFSSASQYGTTHNDLWATQEDKLKTKTNNSGGIQGGLSNGMPIYFDVAFKPVATIMRDQQTVDREGKVSIIAGKGRHDPCVVPRAVPIVEAMAALVICDHYLRNRLSRIDQVTSLT